MTTWKQLSRPLRAAIAAPWLLIVAAVALGSTPAFRELVLDPANNPTTDVSLSSTHWIGTLDAARLPASVFLLNGNCGITDFGGGTYLVERRLLFVESDSMIFGDGPDFVWNDDEVQFGYDGNHIYGDLALGQVTANTFTGDGDGLTFFGGQPLSAVLNDARVDFANNADNANNAFNAYNSFDDFFHAYGYNLDVSLPGDGTASFANGNVQISPGGSLQVSGMICDGTGGDGYFLDGFGGLTLGFGTAQGYLSVNGYLITDSDTYLYTGAQPYVAGVVTPTGSITIKDATGAIYRIPAVAQ